MSRWLNVEAQDESSIKSAFDQPGVHVRDQYPFSDGVLGVIEADENKFQGSQLDSTLSSNQGIKGISVYRDEQHARDMAKRLTQSGRSTNR